MYVGSLDARGLFDMFKHAFFYLATFRLCGESLCLSVTTHEDGSISITANDWITATDGRAASLIDDLAASSTATGKARDYQAGASLGSLVAVNYLSDRFEFTVNTEEKKRTLRWSRGVEEPVRDLTNRNENEGIVLHWHPDPEIFGEASLDSGYIRRFLQSTGPLLRGTTIRYNDLNDRGEAEVYRFDQGVVHLAEHYNSNFSPVPDPIYFICPISDQEGYPGEIEFAAQFRLEPGETIISACNLHYTRNGGSHATGFLAGFSSAMKDTIYGEVRDPRLDGPGYTAIIAARLRRPQFEGCTRSWLQQPEIEEQVANTTKQAIADYIASSKMTFWW